MHDATFSVAPYFLPLLREVADACTFGSEVTVTYRDGAGAFEQARGVARHVVKPYSMGFALEWTQDCRLRLSGTFEHFIRLGDITAVHAGN